MHIKQLSQSEPSLPRVLHAGLGIENRRNAKLAAAQNARDADRSFGRKRPGVTFRARHRPTFEATSVVYVSPNFPATLKASEEQDYPYDSYIEEQVHSVAGYNVLTDALRKLKPGVWRFPGESLESAVDRLQHSLTVKRDGLSYQVRISLDGIDPTHLAEIVNAVTDSYLERHEGRGILRPGQTTGGPTARTYPGAK